MQIVLTGAVEDDGNDKAPIFYTADGVPKQITWGELHGLFEQRVAEKDLAQTGEQRLLARIVAEFWVDSSDWWNGATVSDDSF